MLRRSDELMMGPLPVADAGSAGVALRDVPPRSWRLPVPHLWALLLITAFGGVLRFYRLAEPVLWNDETLIYWRVCGTYGQMLVPLHDRDLFPPLQYSLYWLIGHPVPVGAVACRAVLGWTAALALTAVAGGVTGWGLRRESAAWVRVWVPVGAAVFVGVTLAVLGVVLGPGWLVPRSIQPVPRTLKLTPWVMRVVPAISGTLMVPAMYFLARQLLPRGASLVAALVTACSAFTLFYSRDAKMYSDAWVLEAVNVGCLLWWFRTGKATAWLGWVAAGCGMVGLNGNTAAVPGVCLLFLLTQRRLKWQTTVLFLAGLGLIAAGPAGYYGKFNTGPQRVENVGWSATGLGWVGGFFNGNRTGPEHVGYTASSFLAGYEWPRDDYLPQIIEPLRDVPQTVVLEVVAVLALAALPWPLLRTIFRPDRQAAREAAAPEPAWRVWLWLAAWVVVPIYGYYYAHSVDNFVSPWYWLWTLGESTNAVQWTVALATVETLAIAALFYRHLRPAVGRLAKFWLATAVLFGLCLAAFAAAYPAAMGAWFAGRPWGLAESVWEPRYLGFVWPAVGVGVAALLMRLPTWPVRAAAVTFVCMANLFLADMRLALATEPPIDRLCDDVWAAQDPAGTVRTYDNIPRDGIEVAGTSLGVTNTKIAGGRYYLQMHADRPLTPDLFERSLSPTFPHPYLLRERLPAAAVRADLLHTPNVRRVILWSQLLNNDRLTYDPYRSALPGGFRLASEQEYPVRVVWDWRLKWRWVRREYVRAGNPR